MDPSRYKIIAYLPIEDSDDYKIVEYKVQAVVPNLEDFMKILGAEKWEVQELPRLPQPPVLDGTP